MNRSRKEFLAVLTAIMTLVALAIDLMLPALADMRASFGLAEDDNAIARVFTVFYLGLAVAQLAWGPASDRYGRKPVLLGGVWLYIAGATASAIATDLPMLFVARFVWGVGGAGMRVAATAMIRDRYEGSEMASIMSHMMAVFLLVPILAPGAGGLLLLAAPWRSLFWLCAITAMAGTFWTARLPETLPTERRQSLAAGGLRSSLSQLGRSRVFIGYTAASMFLQGVFTAWLGSSQIIVADILGRGRWFPVVFGSVAVVMAVGMTINGGLVRRYGLVPMLRTVVALALAGTLGLLAFALAVDGRPGFWAFMPLLGVLLSIFLVLMPNLSAAALEPVGAVAGTATAVSSAIRLGGGALIAATIDARVTTTVTPFLVGVAVLAALGAVSIGYAQRIDTGSG